MTWLGWVLWHINQCRLFNSKYSLYIYIKYILFGLVGFYSISISVGYLMPNPVYIYIYIYIYIGFGLVGFYGISTSVGYLMLNLLHTYIRGVLNKFPDFFWIGIQNCRSLLKIQYLIAIQIMG